MFSLWSQNDVGNSFGLNDIGLARYFLSAFLVRQFSVVWVVFSFEEDSLSGRLSPYLLQPLHPLFRYVASHLAEQATRLPFAIAIAITFFDNALSEILINCCQLLVLLKIPTNVS